MKKFLFSAAAIAASSPALLFAEGENTGATVTPPSIVQVSDIQGTIVTAIQPWVAAGLGIGIAVFCIYLGWRLIRRFTR